MKIKAFLAPYCEILAGFFSILYKQMLQALTHYTGQLQIRTFNNSNENASECHLISIGENPNDQKSSPEKLSWSVPLYFAVRGLSIPLPKNLVHWKVNAWLLICLNLGSSCTARERGSQPPAFSLCPHGAAQQLPRRKGNYPQIRLQQWHGLAWFNHLQLSNQESKGQEQEFRETDIKLGWHDSNLVTLWYQQSCHLDFAEPDFSKEISSAPT